MTAPGKVTVAIDDDRIKERMRESLAQAWDEGFVRASTLLTEDIASGNLPERNPYRGRA